MMHPEDSGAEQSASPTRRAMGWCRGPATSAFAERGRLARVMLAERPQASSDQVWERMWSACSSLRHPRRASAPQDATNRRWRLVEIARARERYPLVTARKRSYVIGTKPVSQGGDFA